MKRVKTGVGGKPDPEIIPIVSSMVTKATGKAGFEDCPIAVADLGLLVTGASAALTAESQAIDLVAQRRTERKDAFAELRDGVAQFADFARSLYKGDKALLQAVGLDVVEPVPVGVLPPPTNLRSKPGVLEQTIELRWNFVPGRDFYTAECAEASSGPWTEIYKGKAGRTTCADLVSGKEYFFRTRAWGSSGAGGWSDITKTRAS